MKVLVYSLLLLFVLGEASAQDTARVNQLNKLSTALFSSNPDRAFYYSQQSDSIARKINYPHGLADALVAIGHIDYLKGRSTEASKKFDEAIAIYKRINDKRGLSICYDQYGRMDTQLANYSLANDYLNKAVKIEWQSGDDYNLTECYNDYGNLNNSQGKLSKALDFYYQALNIAFRDHYRILSAELYNNIGSLLLDMQIYPNALAYFQKSLQILKSTNNYRGLGILYENVGEVLLYQNKPDQAISYLVYANNIVKKQNDKEGLSSVYTDLGLCFANKKQLKKAISYLDTSLRIASAYKILYNQAYALVGYATVYNMQKDFKQALSYGIRGQQLGHKLDNLSLIANVSFQLSKTYAGLGQNGKAYQSINEYLDLKKKLNNDQTIEELTSYTYELNNSVMLRLKTQQQHEKDLIYQQNSRFHNLIFLIIILAMIIISIIYYKAKNKQEKINILLKTTNEDVLKHAVKLNEHISMKNRLIGILAHDLRSPLSTLRGLFTLLQDDTISHEEMLKMLPSVVKKLEHTSDFLDTLLFWINSQMENFDPTHQSFSLAELVNRVVINLDEQLVEKSVKVNTDIPDKLIAKADPNTISIVLRNLLINAIKFSYVNSSLQITAKHQGDNILIKVNDEGTGMTTAQAQKLFKEKVNSERGTNDELGTGLGLLFCKDLIEKCNGSIWVESELGVGSEFSFTVPC